MSQFQTHVCYPEHVRFAEVPMTALKLAKHGQACLERSRSPSKAGCGRQAPEAEHAALPATDKIRCCTKRFSNYSSNLCYTKVSQLSGLQMECGKELLMVSGFSRKR